MAPRYGDPASNKYLRPTGWFLALFASIEPRHNNIGVETQHVAGDGCLYGLQESVPHKSFNVVGRPYAGERVSI